MSRTFDHHLPLTLEQRARRRLALKAGFAIHATVFTLVNLGLYLASQVGGWGHAVVPIWGWARGLAIHGTVVAVKLSGEGIGQRMLEREIDTLKRREGR